jgi:hypothetical protein
MLIKILVNIVIFNMFNKDLLRVRVKTDLF